MPDEKYNSAYSGQQIDNAISRALPNGAIDTALKSTTHINLLDNPFFNVDSRGGKIIPINAPYWNATSGGTFIGYTDKAYNFTVTADRADWVQFVKDGVTYYTTTEYVVRGYIGEGYSVDRWYGFYSNVKVTVNNGNITISNIGSSGTITFRQKFANAINSQTFTASIDVESITGSVAIYLRTDTHTAIGKGVSTTGITSKSGTTEATGTYYFDIQLSAGASVTVKSVKLELGSVSTLANDTAPDTETERFKCAISTADASDTYANKPSIPSRPNLLDNPWFTVNQRGQATYAGNGYAVDRWKMLDGAGGGSTVTVNNDGTITVTNPSTQTDGVWFSYLDTFLKSVPYTISVDVVSYSGNVNIYIGATGAFKVSSTGISSKTITPTADGNYVVRFVVAKGASVTLKAVKLELGNGSTLALDSPPNYADELARCQRYCTAIASEGSVGGIAEYVGFGQVNTATQVRISLPTPTTMRFMLNASITTSDLSALKITTVNSSGNVVDVTPTAISLPWGGATNVQSVLLTVASGSVTVGHSATLRINQSGRIVISHDL